MMIFFWYFYYDKAKTFCRGFSGIDTLHIRFYRSNVSGHCNTSEHVGV